MTTDTSSTPGPGHHEAMRRVALATAFVLAVTACSGDDVATPSTTGGGVAATPPADTATEPSIATTAPVDTTAPTTPSSLPPAVLEISPGTEQATITDATPGEEVELVGDDGAPLATGSVDAFGALIFRDLEGGAVVSARTASARSDTVTVLRRDEHPDTDFYSGQTLPTEGLGYIATRDGTTLSASVWLPGPAEGGPYPTVVEYSGYTPSDPDSAGFSTLLNTLGYAYVGVNIRGTGCSGGSFDYFEYTQSLDGYDVVETVAAQPWVMNHRAGMVGVSYPGISQLFVAQTQPPSLAAITPFSVIADTAISTLYPGGILNTGFAVEWGRERARDAEPSGQGWAAERIADGDEQCEANQQLRLQNTDLEREMVENAFWTDEVAAELAPRLFVDRITVPTFVAGAFQDEQTGGHFATMLDRFTGTDRFFVTLMNGLHTDALGPANLARYIEFLDLYVAERVPSLTVARTGLPLLAAGLYGTTDVALPVEDRFADMTYAEALAAFEAEPPVRVVFEQGAAEGFPARAPMARYVAEFESWPIPDATPATWLLSGDGISGGLLDAEATGADAEQTTYLALPEAIPPTLYDGSSSDIWSVDVTYDWVEAGLGTFASWATTPLTEELVVAGTGSVDLWMLTNLGDTDVEVTITEIRPDGQEMYVQSGWLRASHRALDEAESTDLRPVHTHLEVDAAPLSDTDFELVRVELFPFAHTFREGSRIRLVVDAPGGNRPVWDFATIGQGEQVTIAHDTASPSQLVLPIVSGIDAPEAYPECGSLRGQPCRPYAGG